MKRTFQPSIVSKKRKHGFLARMSSSSGKKIIIRQRTKKRAILAS